MILRASDLPVIFDPRGLMGRAYWDAILPVHNLISAGCSSESRDARATRGRPPDDRTGRGQRPDAATIRSRVHRQRGMLSDR
jgi:hypothetical protein